jgi:hypothetical protein
MKSAKTQPSPCGRSFPFPPRRKRETPSQGKAALPAQRKLSGISQKKKGLRASASNPFSCFGLPGPLLFPKNGKLLAFLPKPIPPQTFL